MVFFFEENLFENKMIELKNINKKYQIKDQEVIALENINLHINRGEIFGVMGKSGAGKSTLIRCVNLLERPTTGSVKVNQQELTTLSAGALRQARHRIGMVFQHFNLLSSKTVYDNIALPLQLIGVTKKEIEKTIIPLLELIELNEKRTAFPSQLSGGQKQRVAIARALATKPLVLLCDEMTSALDPETTSSILQLIKEINEQMQLTIMLITHEMDVIKRIADQVAVLHHGRIIEQNDVISIFKNPQSAVAQSFIRSALNTKLSKQLTAHIVPEPIPNGEVILRLTFIGHVAAEPIINDLLKQFTIRVNILQANFEYLRHDVFGVMVLAVQAEPAQLEKAFAFLNSKGLQTEVLGYVRNDDQLIN